MIAISEVDRWIDRAIVEEKLKKDRTIVSSVKQPKKFNLFMEVTSEGLGRLVDDIEDLRD